MSIDNKTTEEKMDQQRTDIERKKQYDTVVGLGWKNFGIAFFVIVIAIVIYVFFFR
ncbi:hypothetical protein [Virgibacillus halodenitrificans]|uniref:YqzM family protein n=1 Tax=Virgibacillus halodenitrificans TaxID=1482 RepID=A0ABR7VLA9_VIRHA|nr:hypothetical protein [Virgibacillus halodenitrificans]MBD1222050.1 hypothetical protein [Virgibacillus halodenitrificans]MCG1028808.1 hypothetical protein [Virgibacillus halodenitrificans]MEC2158853.1 hypothetical protein [Virgibacillus halodenitrificans]